MTIVDTTENPPLATAIRGYDRAAVDAAIAREAAQLRALESRAAQLERALCTPPTVGERPVLTATVVYVSTTPGAPNPAPVPASVEIGRASCRERVLRLV